MRRHACLVASLAAVVAASAAAYGPRLSAYDPLKVGAAAVRSEDLTVRDEQRKRDIPVRAYLPAHASPAPVVLFSHGLGGSRSGNRYLGEHWAQRGYVAIFVQHPGSDDSVWRGQPLLKRMSEMKKAASAANFMLRVRDIPAVLDRLARWNAEAGNPLVRRMDLAHVGMSGHSFGAVTTQAVSGESFGRLGPRFTDARIKAAVAFSPSSPGGRAAKQAFGGVRIPWMLMTGTRDVALIGDADVASRLAVFPALPPGDKYEVVLFDAEHSAFADRALPGDRAARNPNHHRVVLGLTTAFWDAYLRRDPAARAWLAGTGPRSLLEPRDTWKRK